MATNRESPFQIPERTSSLLPATYRDRIKNLRKSSTDLKRKASTISQRSTTARTEFVDAQIKISKNDFHLYTTMFRGLKEAWESGEVTGTEFKVQGKEIWRKRVRLNKERTALQQDRHNILERVNTENPQMMEAYRTPITAIFPSKSAPSVSERRDKHAHNRWKQHLHRWYDAEEPLKEGQTSQDRQVWCPILKRFFDAPTRCAAHILPHFLGYENIAWMLGAEGDVAEGSSLVWDFRNGMVMAKRLEKQFDEGDFVIVPIPTPTDEPQRLRFVLLNKAYSHHPVLEGNPQRYSDLDGSELEFRGPARPGLRFLYWHYVTSILRAIKWEKTNWTDWKARFPDGPMWATPGPYLRKSMLSHLGRAIGDYDLNDEDFRGGAYDGIGHKSSTDEEEIAAKVADKLEIDSDDDSDDDGSGEGW